MDKICNCSTCACTTCEGYGSIKLADAIGTAKNCPACNGNGHRKQKEYTPNTFPWDWGEVEIRKKIPPYTFGDRVTVVQHGE